MLIKAWDIVIKCFSLYKKNWQVLFKYLTLLFIPLGFLAIIGTIVDPIISQGITSTVNLIIAIGYFILYVIAILIELWISIAITRISASMYTGKELLPLSEELTDARFLLWPAVAASIIVAIAAILGTILFIIPGVIIGVWFVFTMEAIAIDEIKKPIEAIKFSKSLTNKRWWAVLWRLALPWIVFAVIAIIPQQILKYAIVFLKQSVTLGTIANVIAMSIINILVIIVGLLFTPLTIFAKVILFLELKKVPAPTKE